MKGHTIATLISFILFVLIVVSTDKFNYALDYELNLVRPECNYNDYVKDRHSCIK